MFADCIYFSCETVGSFFETFSQLMHVILAQLSKCGIESARLHAVSHDQGMQCHKLGSCMKVRHSLIDWWRSGILPTSEPLTI